ncbi:MAG: PEGA domain-containing protein [Myxococcota bacterium]
MRWLTPILGVWIVGCGGTPPASVETLPESPVILLVGAGLEDPPENIVVAEPLVGEPARTASEAALEEARAAYRDLDFERALAAARQAQVLLESERAGGQDFERLHRVLLYRAMAEQGLGREDDAAEALRDAIAIRPAADPPEGAFPPSLRDLHRQVKATMATEPPRVMSITAVPADAEVSIDGRPSGRAPLSVNASRGRHFIEVRAVGYAPRSLSVDLRDTDPPPLHIALPALNAEALQNALASATVAELSALQASERTALRERLELDWVVRVNREAGGEDVTRLRGRGVSLSSGAVREAEEEGSDRSSMLRLLRRFSDDAVPTMGGLDTHSVDAGEREDDGGSVFASPWFWTVVGVVVVGTAVGVTLALTLEPDPVLVVEP